MEMDIKHKVVTVRQSEWVLWMEKHLTTVLRVCNLFYPTDDYGKKELYQEILLHLWKGYGQRREDVPEHIWVYRVAVNTAVSSKRAEMRRPETVPLTASMAERLADNAEMESNPMLDELRGLIMQLDESEQTMIDLYLKGIPQAEIARIFSMTETNVSTKIGRIKKKIINMRNNKK